jgi:flavin-dependent dehydrogenase
VSGTWDVLVAGAGPAGAVAACVLARAGHRVLIVDRLRDHKVGEALPPAACRILRNLGLSGPETNDAHTKIGGNLSCWGSEDLIARDFLLDPEGSAWRLDRAQFNGDLRSDAIRVGASFQKTLVRSIMRADGQWDVELADGQVTRVTWLVDATGRRASIARRAGARRLRDEPLVAVWAIGESAQGFDLNMSIIEAVRDGWWYVARLPCGAPTAFFFGRPAEATVLLRQPLAWEQAIEKTTHVRKILRGFRFPFPTRGTDASGGRLDRFAGDGWIACGDAALSFDPISAQGLLTAVHSGMGAGEAVDKALRGDARAIRAYVGRHEEIRRVYLSRWHEMYIRGDRWPNAPFWSSTHLQRWRRTN